MTKERFRYQLMDLYGNVVIDDATAEEIGDKLYVSPKTVRYDAANDALLLHQYHVTRRQIVFPKRFTVIDKDTGEKIVEHADCATAAKAVEIDDPPQIWNAAHRGYTIRGRYKVIDET